METMDYQMSSLIEALSYSRPCREEHRPAVSIRAPGRWRRRWTEFIGRATQARLHARTRLAQQSGLDRPMAPHPARGEPLVSFLLRVPYSHRPIDCCTARADSRTVEDA
jgi:hypothetical protein